MTVGEAIRQLCPMRERMQALDERIVRLRERAAHSRQQLNSAHGSANSDRLADYISKLDELEANASAELIRYESMCQKVECAIADLPEITKTLITLHWLNGYTWRETAQRMQYDTDYIRHLGYEARDNLENIEV